MKCYNHHDRDAFGVCKTCGKGLCLECMNTKNSEVRCKSGCSKNFGMRNILLGTAYLVVIVLLLVSIFE